jgi:hypothetical protein
VAPNTLHFGFHVQAGIDFMFLHDMEKIRCHAAGVKLGTLVFNPPFWTVNGVKSGAPSDLNIPGYYASFSSGPMFL